ncbi:MAG TPA: acetyl-CoA carboxylase biotin carboxyl carrier protein subunit, partial [Gemmobacter sp.]|nr:acetyl-CoA carboxylase biotin carboxyl carrier protein subunit [Gemmobacter sp.]
RWIETEFRADLAGHARVAAVPDPGLWRGEIEIDGRRHRVALPLALFGGVPASQIAPQQAPETPGTITAPVSGSLMRWLVPEGHVVNAGEAVAVMEAMKMETRIEAPLDGRLSQLANEGDTLAFGAPLARIIV